MSSEEQNISINYFINEMEEDNQEINIDELLKELENAEFNDDFKVSQMIDYQGKRHTIPRTSLPANPRTSIGIDLARGSFGGPYRKSRKSRRSKKSKSRKSRS